ncbi:serine/threonine-protein kinase SBK1 [Zootermopsis nevadensis]|uniref:Serine/threonine-protein kinase SBK1 n=1 Tax=Zootermopsis nevadensis TaxID=136037 RepID=A0A067RB56_ZOONE|nr:serine/threonine-protein kinase SBK1 [Zootermopsis nevadensis]KDR20034.1 Serine/threonine-protein kinase SBK1 [Zootermopsis nevadensis]
MKNKEKEMGVHNIQKTKLDDIDISTEYDIRATLAEGSFARILLVRHRRTSTKVVLKAIHMELTAENEFDREYHYSYHLSAHPNILSVYPVAFTTQNCFVFAQEYAPLGDLSGSVKAGGLSELYCKRIAEQLVSAVTFLHSLKLVHRDLKLENILVFAADMTLIKLCDFGATVREGTMVTKHRCIWQPFLPPEICELVSNERYECKLSSDCWQLGIILFVCLTGCPPWQSADISDSDYCNFMRWQKRKTTKVPVQFRPFTSRFLRMIKRLLERKPDKRSSATEIIKYLRDRWIDRKTSGKTSSCGGGCASSSVIELSRRESINMYLYQLDDKTHLVDESKNRLKKLLSGYGLETTIDQKAMTKRVWEWLLQCDYQTTAKFESV